MSALAAGSGNPTHKWGRVPGQKVGGDIAGFRDIQARDFDDKKKLKVYPDGNPIMETVLTLEQPDGSLVDVYVSGKRMKDAVRNALRDQGASDVAENDHIEILFTDYDGNARVFQATYSVFDPTV